MTLNTNIYVLDEIDPAEVFHQAASLMHVRDDYQFTNGPHWMGSLNAIAAEPGQGYPAWLILQYRPGGVPIATADGNAAALATHLADTDPETHKYCEGDDHSEWERDELYEPCWLSFDYDTAYGYRGPNGEDCNDLHAGYIRQMGAWFDARGIRWKWQNEYTGEIFTGYDGLAQFAHNGDQAQGWFTNDVLPKFEQMGIIQ